MNFNLENKSSTLLNSTATTQESSLRQAVTNTLKEYYNRVNVKKTSGVYKRLLAEIENPLLQETMRFVRGNQSLGASILGLSRATLRKLLIRYNLYKKRNKTPILEMAATEKLISLFPVVSLTLKKYYSQIDPQHTSYVYKMVLAEMEEPLLQETMLFVNGNQSQAAIVLGLNRGTLRKLLKKYHLN